PPDIRNRGQGTGGGLKIENPPLPTSRHQRGDEVLPNEPTAACDKYARHAADGLKLNYLRSRCGTLRMPLDDDGEIAPKAQRDKQLRHDKHWSEQQVGRVVDQGRLSSVQHGVA